ncbi:LysR family transcriptional regulator [Streptomyces sp. XM4193]|uniref:LysR family transcriptional regulator n=1 Tax=Streptomyces sp. XM4193 TaxID=2929782 RepID=UPI001FF722CB|nr:LysR family transcriptional regulator [Streptomyces sp. XM4193]MCK1795951.1 LysR family transcriptional regulator [Streptomyces sp. XM4193]
MTVELRHLRAFVTIAEEGTVTGASVRLGIGQPALSRTLRQLEEHLGVRLVDRSTHHLHLTAEGTALLPRAASALAAAEAVLDPVRLGRRPLRLGHAWSAAGGRTVALLRAWEAAHPDTALELLRIDDRSAGLARGRVDAALLRGEPADLALLELPLRTEWLLTEPRVAAVPDGDPLAAREEVTLAELADRPIAVNTVSGTTTPRLWPAGGRPERRVEVANTDDWLAIIAAGRAVGVTVDSTAGLRPHPGVTYLPLTDAPALPLVLGWLDPPAHPLVGRLAALARRVMSPEAGSQRL